MDLRVRAYVMDYVQNNIRLYVGDSTVSTTEAFI